MTIHEMHDAGTQYMPKMVSRQGSQLQRRTVVAVAPHDFWELLLWASPLLLLVVRLTLFQRGRDPNAFAAVDTRSVLQAMLICSMLLLLSGTTAARKVIARSNRGPWLGFWVYAIWCVCSASWSRLPIYTLYRCIEVGAIAWYCLFLVDRAADRVQAKQLIVAIVGFYIALDVPRYGSVVSLLTRNMHTNSFTCAAAIVLCLALTLRKHGGAMLRYGIPAFLLVAIAGGTSSGSNVATVAGAATFAVCLPGRRSKVLLAFWIAAVAVALTVGVIGTDTVHSWLFPGKNAEAVSTMTGRVNMWQHYWGAAMERPLHGYGFCVGEKSGADFGYFVTQSAHNSLLSVLVNTGWIGVTLYFVVFLGRVFCWTLRALSIDHCSDDVAAVLAGSVACLVNSMTYPVLGSGFACPSLAIFLLWAYAEKFIWRHDGRDSPPSRAQFRSGPPICGSERFKSRVMVRSKDSSFR